MGQMMPPPQMGMPPQMGPARPSGWRERWMHRFGMDMLNRTETFIFPNWLIGKSIVFFFVAMIACWGAFGFVPEFDLWIVAALSVVLFFYGSSALSKEWTRKSDKAFVRNIFIAGFVIRILWVLYCYFVFNPSHFDNTYGSGADVDWYIPFGKDITQWIAGDSKMTLSQILDYNGSGMDDSGYSFWLGIVYFVFGVENEIFIPFLLKCLMGAYCAVSIYHIAKRHFGNGVARMAAIFICVNPNMIYWSGAMMKEAEMIFLCCLAIDNFDRVLSSGQRYTFKTLLPGVLSGLALMFFRAPLAILIFLSVFAHIVMASGRVMSIGKKIIAGALVASVLAVSVGDRIQQESRQLLDSARSKERQEENLEFRANREGGNSFAKYAGTAVFAPLIFTIPFPTFNSAQEGQLTQIQLSGGSYIKNILSFFVIIVMFLLLISGEWRRHVFILAYTVGYHVILVFSSYAQSGRFHMPVWPMFLFFAAYGIQLAKTNAKFKKWFPIALVVEVAICLFWNWYKLKGRGMI